VFLENVDPIDLDFVHDAVDKNKILLSKDRMVASLEVNIQDTMKAIILSFSFMSPT